MRILLVDDEADSRYFVARFLRQMGHEVSEAGQGKEALQALEQLRYHMVLTDIRMPGMSGLDVLAHIRRVEDPPDVVVYTAFGNMQTVIEALRLGAYDYLLKPINVDELMALIERVQEHQVLLEENRFLTRHLDDAIQERSASAQREAKEWREAYINISGIGDVVMASPTMKQVFEQVEVLHGDRSLAVLIQGETGTGKELIARHIHYGTKQSAEVNPFIDINCAAIQEGLFESELFGYESGSFTGGLAGGKKGKFDLARGGTLFLDEISELPLEMQSKLLRVIQEHEYYRVGGLKKQQTDVRIICASNADLKKRVDKGCFRADLFYRLSTALIQLPPLRERREDILPLTILFLKEFSRKRNKSFEGVSPQALEKLLAYHWPGNVRELRNLMEWVVLMYDGPLLQTKHLQKLESPVLEEKAEAAAIRPSSWRDFILPEDALPLKEFEDWIVEQAVTKFEGNKTRAAQYLSLSLRSLNYRLKQ